MRKLAIILITLALFASACGDGDDAFGPAPDISAGTLDRVTVVGFHGEVDVSLVELSTTVSSDRMIDVEIVPIAGNPKALDACSGSAKLSDEDYKNVIDALAALNPLNYESTIEESCDTTRDGQCIAVSFMDVWGGEASFSVDIAGIDPLVYDLATLMGGLSGEYVPECFEEDGDDDGDDSDVTIYRVPIINPSELPRPTRLIP